MTSEGCTVRGKTEMHSFHIFLSHGARCGDEECIVDVAKKQR